MGLELFGRNSRVLESGQGKHVWRWDLWTLIHLDKGQNRDH